MITTNARQVATDLGKIEKVAFAKTRLAVQAGGELVEQRWQANAVESSGQHGVHYPKAVESNMTGGLEATVKPNPTMPQGNMSFEYGSRNQPPHLDGQRAVDACREVVFNRIAAAVGGAL
jgi:hypothetical protein